MKIDECVALQCYDKVIGFYESFDTMDGYLMATKIEKIQKMGMENSIFGYETYTERFFNDHTVNPQDMDISIEFSPGGGLWQDCIQLVSTSSIVDSPGRHLKFFVIENNTKKILGFCKLNSPPLFMKPRNEFFGGVLPFDELNKRVINGYNIVPVQPFGFNCLGGKLLTLLCTTNVVKDYFDERFGSDLNHFETTSLYGSIKNVSQYDGLKPFVRYGGETESNHYLFPADSVYEFLCESFKTFNDGDDIVESGGSNAKLKKVGLMIGLLVKHFKEIGDDERALKLRTVVKDRSKINTKKRYYYGPMGNNFDEVVTWWKKKAVKRWNNLQEQKRIRPELEIWNEQAFTSRLGDVIR